MTEISTPTPPAESVTERREEARGYLSRIVDQTRMLFTHQGDSDTASELAAHLNQRFNEALDWMAPPAPVWTRTAPTEEGAWWYWCPSLDHPDRPELLWVRGGLDRGPQGWYEGKLAAFRGSSQFDIEQLSAQDGWWQPACVPVPPVSEGGGE